MLLVLLMNTNCRQSENKGEEARVRDALHSMPWYDGKKEDYRKYSPEDIRKMIPRSRKMSESDSAASFLSFLSQGFFYAFVTLVIVGLLAAIFYYLYRIARERTPRSRLNVSESAREGIRYGALSNLTGLSVPPDEAELKRRIEKALAEGDRRSTAIYLFLYALVRLDRRGLLNLRPSSTAREYAGQLEDKAKSGSVQGESGPAVTVHLFNDLIASFEMAAYAGRDPDEDQSLRWNQLRKELG